LYVICVTSGGDGQVNELSSPRVHGRAVRGGRRAPCSVREYLGGGASRDGAVEPQIQLRGVGAGAAVVAGDPPRPHSASAATITAPAAASLGPARMFPSLSS